MKTYRIYTLKDPNTLEVRYVGVTTRKLNERLAQHKWEGLHKKGTYKRNWIKSLLKKGQLPIIELLEETEKVLWEEKEKYWINFYSNLTNTLEGGKGVIVDRTTDSIERSSKAKYKPILQIDDKGNIIREFESIVEATNFFKFKSNSSINNALKNSGNSKKAGGFFWAYKDTYKSFKDLIKPKDKRKKVAEIDENNNIIKIFKSITEAAKYYGVTTSRIAVVCTNKNARCKNKNFIFYKE